MSERREFVKVERTDGKARYSVTVPIEVDPIHARIEILQRMVEMHQAKLEETERRIAAMERKLQHKGGAE